MLDMKASAEKDALTKLQKKLRALIAEIEEASAGGDPDAAAMVEEGAEDGGDELDGMGSGGDFGEQDGMDGEEPDAVAAVDDDLQAARQAYFKQKPAAPRRPGTALGGMLADAGGDMKPPMPRGKPGKKGAA